LFECLFHRLSGLQERRVRMHDQECGCGRLRLWNRRYLSYRNLQQRWCLQASQRRHAL
jgi:hypothetical protein